LNLLNRLCVTFLVLALSGCSREPTQLTLSGPTMGTIYAIKIADPPRQLSANDVQIAIDEELRRIDESMSGYREDSEISRFNATASTEWIEVSREVAEVVHAALEVSEHSAGAFDVTVAPIVRAWGFGSAKHAPANLPDEQAMREVRKSVGYQKVHVRLSPSAIKKDVPELTIDLNGIAPGYAVDRLAVRFDALHLTNYMIDIGGEIRVRGRNAEQEKWRIAVERPTDTEAVPFAILSLRDTSVTTSGEYRHYYDRDGKRYSHTIDPRTARPVDHHLASVVVVHPQSMYADAWATAYNVLGADAGYELANRLGMPVMFILEDESGQLVSRMASGFEKYLAAEEGRL
jgi:thiamine biosynthesis lipoprotein